MILYYKILCGYNSEQAVPILSDELEKAYGIFLLGGRSIFSGGAVDGRYIHTIVPDWHRIMGWTQEYKLTSDDWMELRKSGVDTKARDLLQNTQERVKLLIASGKTDQIGAHPIIPELDRPHFDRREGIMKQIGEIKTRYEDPLSPPPTGA